jgi:hypothetical protein
MAKQVLLLMLGNKIELKSAFLYTKVCRFGKKMYLCSPIRKKLV